ncbi:hypothetical protein Desti_0253 [Desulfomonile tiedjei DSM 6799]|uniref:Uncharacterized protein n=1 Tax=Desulfomonile tiedjei (strain ATCC 49306 / DSM 6799 / DCB-1) TaxID=706587 RepID=I4C0A7_DESTA|nr:hypothetical protein Desti_0253 [Desulfomonile tiedjei DSM 6799]
MVKRALLGFVTVLAPYVPQVMVLPFIILCYLIEELPDSLHEIILSAFGVVSEGDFYSNCQYFCGQVHVDTPVCPNQDRFNFA